MKAYRGLLTLLLGLAVGCGLGLWAPAAAAWLKPVGDVFLNLLFTVVVPLVLFVISAAVAGLDGASRLGRLIGVGLGLFAGTALVAAAVMVPLLALSFPALRTALPTVAATSNATPLAEQLTSLFTADTFYELFSRQHMLALIVLAVLLGLATRRAGAEGQRFLGFLRSGSSVMLALMELIMLAAPVGLGAYLGYTVSTIGTELLAVYAQAVGLYYGAALGYYALLFSFYAYLSGGRHAVAAYWRCNVVPSLTALATCSSVATLPANLVAAEQLRVPAGVRNLLIPLATSLHKDGSSLGAMLKIAVVFSLFGRDFWQPDVVLTALGISVVTSVVAGGIPNGGFTGELFIVTAYGLPPQALPVLIIISTLIDPMATLLNATGDTVVAMLAARLTAGRRWWLRPAPNSTADVLQPTPAAVPADAR